jgi:hypothetical protein
LCNAVCNIHFSCTYFVISCCYYFHWCKLCCCCMSRLRSQLIIVLMYVSDGCSCRWSCEHGGCCSGWWCMGERDVLGSPWSWCMDSNDSHRGTEGVYATVMCWRNTSYCFLWSCTCPYVFFSFFWNLMPRLSILWFHGAVLALCHIHTELIKVELLSICD